MIICVYWSHRLLNRTIKLPSTMRIHGLASAWMHIANVRSLNLWGKNRDMIGSSIRYCNCIRWDLSGLVEIYSRNTI